MLPHIVHRQLRSAYSYAPKTWLIEIIYSTPLPYPRCTISTSLIKLEINANFFASQCLKSSTNLKFYLAPRNCANWYLCRRCPKMHQNNHLIQLHSSIFHNWDVSVFNQMFSLCNHVSFILAMVHYMKISTKTSQNRRK
jgi:hypothetical protein